MPFSLPNAEELAFVMMKPAVARPPSFRAGSSAVSAAFARSAGPRFATDSKYAFTS
jgi:hypothetical protein